MCVNVFKLTRNMTPIKINNQKKNQVCFLFYCSFVCIYAYASVCLKKTTIIKQPIKIVILAGVTMNQAVPAYLITAHLLCAFLLYLAL